MKVTKILQYQGRTAISVCFDSDEPEWVHIQGEQSRDRGGELEVNESGEPILIDGSVCPLGETGETCHNCHYNWKVQEFLWDGAAQFTGDGATRKSADVLLEELLQRVAANELQPVDGGLDSIVGRLI